MLMTIVATSVKAVKTAESASWNVVRFTKRLEKRLRKKVAHFEKKPLNRLPKFVQKEFARFIKKLLSQPDSTDGCGISPHRLLGLLDSSFPFP